MNLYRLLPIILILAPAMAVMGAQATKPAAGPALLAPFKQNLQRALKEGLAQGPVEAIAACQLEAPRVADALSRDGVRLGRTSDRLRNPANAGPEWAATVLEAYLNDSADRTPATVSRPDNRTGYVEPIIVQPLCLTCHGENLAPDLAARINELYPEDRAIGYQVGDLRGVFWVEFPTPE